MTFHSHALEPAGSNQNLAPQHLREIREHRPGSEDLLTPRYRLLSSLPLGLTYEPEAPAAAEAEHAIRDRSMSAKAGRCGSGFGSPAVKEE